MVSVLTLGANGYIGAPFLTALRNEHQDAKISVYLRSTTFDADFAKMNVAVVHGTFDETEKLTTLASQHDIVVNAADSHSTALTGALVKGLSSPRKSKGIMLHVSGLGNFSDGGSSGNLNPGSKVWNDASVEDISSIHDQMFNGGPDKIILDAGARGDIVDFIIAPGGVYGRPKTDIAKGTRGFFVQGMLDNILSLGYSPYTGEGSAIFHLSEINDTVSLMMTVFNTALNGKGAQGPYRRYYNAGGVEKSWKAITTDFAEALHKKGKIQESTSRSVPPEQAGALAGFFGASILIKYDNAKSLGYQPQGPDISEILVDVL